ncbi:hypothetical protein GCM10009123_03010 [Kangiella japonica]|uniref:Uncharacterized protein n=1 Tax=Kangiella japonica TaxID=647384 RepID=A0ABN0SU15_9GAMM
MLAEIISIIAVLVAGLSALYARWAVNEAKKANELNRFEALLGLKSSYLNEMDTQIRLAKDWGENDSYAQACRDKFTKADTKYREICKELDAYYFQLVKTTN